MRPFIALFCANIFLWPLHSKAALGSSTPDIQVSEPTKTPPMPSDIHMSLGGHSSEIPFTSDDLPKAYGFSKPLGKFKNEQYKLKASILGTKKERSKVEKQCSKEPFSLSEEHFGCAFVALKAQMEQPTVGASKKSKKAKKIHPPKASDIREQDDWEKLESYGYRALLPVLKVEGTEEAKVFIAFAQKSKCKTPAVTSALISQMEGLLPNLEAWPLIDSTYAIVADCIPRESDYYETLHQRMGYLNILQKRNDEAKLALNRSLQSKNPKEEYRTLFWRGYVDNDLEIIPSVLTWNKYWERLVTEYPLTQHAVLAHGIFAEHPIASKLVQEPPRMSPHAGNTWDAANLANFIYLNFLTQKDIKTAKEFASKIEGKVTPAGLGPAMFLAAAHRSGGNHRESMRVIYSAARLAGASSLQPEIIKLLYPELYVKEVTKHANGLEVAFVLSLMRQESSFNPNAQSPRGAMGLMQVLPSTARGAKRKKAAPKAPINLKNPDANIAAGCKYLREQIKKYESNEIPTLAAYNAGPTVATRWLERYQGAAPLLWADLVPYPETRSYVSGILRGRFWYRYLMGNSSESQQGSTQELAYAEHLLGKRLAPNIASRTAPSSVLTFLARTPQESAEESEEEPIYSEDF